MKKFISSFEEIAKDEGISEGLKQGFRDGFKEGFNQGLEAGVKRGMQISLFKEMETLLGWKFGETGRLLLDELRRAADVQPLLQLIHVIQHAETPTDIRRQLPTEMTTAPGKGAVVAESSR